MRRNCKKCKAFDKEILKKEIIDELKSTEDKKAFFAENSISRFILGFILTGVLGTWLSSCWQSQQWKEQQAYSAKQKIIEKKYELINEVSEKVSKSYTAAEDIFGLFQYLTDKERKSQKEERINYWRQESREWRINSKKLLSGINANFKNPEITNNINKIIDNRRNIGRFINYNLLPKINIKNIQDDPNIKKSVMENTELIDEATGKEGHLRNLIKLMIEETQIN